MEQIPILRDIAVIFASSLIVLYVCHRLRFPTIVGFLVTGALIGPDGLRLIHDPENVDQLAHIGVILLLFAIGLEFSFRGLIRTGRFGLIGGVLLVALSAVVSWAVGLSLGVSGRLALFLGFLIGTNSTAIVLKTLQERALLDSPHGRMTLTLTVVMDIAIVPTMLITGILAQQSGSAAGSVLSLLVKSAVMTALIVVLARWVTPAILYQVTRTRSRELFLLTIALIAISVTWLSSAAGLSIGLGAFIAGLVISESEYSHHALEGILPFRDVFNSFFFVSIGLLFNTGVLLQNAVPVLAITVGVLVMKTLVGSAVVLAFGMSLRTALLIGLALAGMGEFAFILGKVGFDLGLLDTFWYQNVVGVSVLTMLATPFMITGGPRIADLLARLPLPSRLRRGFARGLPALDERARETLRDHLVIVGFGVNGRNVARAARRTGIRYRIIETNPETVRAERENGELIEFGDATYPEVLRLAGIDTARIIVIAISDPAGTRRVTQLARELNPNLHIVVRTRFVTEVNPLRALGANEVIPEEFETSIEIFTRVLSRFLVPRDEIERLISEIRSDSYEMLRTVSHPAPRMADLPAGISDVEITSVRVVPDSPFAGRNLAQLNLRARCGVNILAIRRGEQVTANPGADAVVEAEDVLYMLGSPAACLAAEQLLRPEE
ncbi:MAG TPA: cation:proton antiporter [candidate division Zixibacteria bacterium]|nr:cation:proton antiporter [candidate division Zixibacteria bacterium]MDD4916385.1 cation:proton antiporter [candidate division Zixibacteria bacterium]MDM7972845.1 cation:proton antiporter [candidate division Zixibacteria bacterium]HPM37690.1 cation:proton antiporter [candidate division Zixibacteria bacterium]